MNISVIKICRLITLTCFCLSFTKLNAQQKAVNAFYFASEIVADSKGNLFVTGKNNKIIKITPDGNAYHFAGHPKGYTQSKDGKGAEAMFAKPSGIAIDVNDNLFIADYTTIRKVTPEGVVTTIYGNPNKGVIKDGNRNTVAFYRLGLIAVDKNGTLYVTDEIFDSLQNRSFNIIRKISQEGNVHTIKNSDGSLFRSHTIEGLACDKDGNLYVSAVAWSSCIKKIWPDETITTVAGVYNENPKNRAYFSEGDIQTARIVKPKGIAINQNGELFFSDPWLHRILKVAHNRVTIVAGGGGKSATGANFMSGSGSGGYTDGKGKQALLIGPNGISFDKAGNLYIVDGSSVNSYIRKFAPDGMVTTFCKHAYNPQTRQYEDIKEAVVTNTQTTQPEIKQVKTQTDKTIDSIMNIAMTSAKLKNFPNNRTSDEKPVKSPGSKNTFEKKFPAKKTMLLASIPKKNLSRQQLMAFLTTLYADLKKKLPATKVSAAMAIISKLNNDAAKIAVAGVVGWYKNAPAEAALLLTYAASQSPDDNTLNNCGAVLNLCGLEEKAVPVLKYALAHEPGNSTLLNNIGQAYAGLGATDSAMVYLMGCIKQYNTHPEACATASYIENKKGNIDKAIKLAEQAIKGGGFSESLFEFYKNIKQDAQLGPLLENNLRGKKYFELNGFGIAPNCRNWQECETVYAKQEAYKKKLEELNKQFGQVATQNSPANVRTAEDFLKWSSNKNWKKGPLSRVAFELRSELFNLYGDQKATAIFDFVNKYTKLGLEEEIPERKAFDDKYAELFRSAKGERISQLLDQQCKERVTIDNKYFDKGTNLAEKFKDDWYAKDIKIYNEIIFLTVLIAPNESVFKSECAAYASWLLSQFSGYSLITCYPNIKPNCSQYDPKKDPGNNSPEFIQANCPINIEAPFGIGKINLDCTSFKIEAGEGIIFNFEKNFITRESTIAVGVGVSAHVPGIQPLEFGAKEQLFIKFDKDNQPIDLGTSWEVELDIKGVGSPEIKAGYTVGINSGWNFEPGALQLILGPL